MSPRHNYARPCDVMKRSTSNEMLAYWRRVYRDPLLDPTVLGLPVSPMWLYNTAPVSSSCSGSKQDAFAWKRVCSDDADLNVSIVEDASYRQVSALPLNRFGHRFLGQHSPGCAWPSRTAFAADHVWLEVLRVAVSRFDGEGGAAGCWFYAAAGSGIFFNVGRSLRVANRRMLATRFDLNWTAVYARWPYSIDRMADLCAHAMRQGFHSIQIGSEWSRIPRQQPTWTKFDAAVSPADTYEHEVISCRHECTSLPTRRMNRACVTGLRTGVRHELPCKCLDVYQGARTYIINCLGTSPGLAPPWVDQSPMQVSNRTPSCASLVRRRSIGQVLFRGAREPGCGLPC